MEAMMSIVVGAAMIYGLYTCNRKMDQYDESEKANKNRCVKVCDPQPVKWYSDERCGCDLSVDIRSNKRNDP